MLGALLGGILGLALLGLFGGLGGMALGFCVVARCV